MDVIEAEAVVEVVVVTDVLMIVKVMVGGESRDGARGLLVKKIP